MYQLTKQSALALLILTLMLVLTACAAGVPAAAPVDAERASTLNGITPDSRLQPIEIHFRKLLRQLAALDGVGNGAAVRHVQRPQRLPLRQRKDNLNLHKSSPPAA